MAERITHERAMKPMQILERQYGKSAAGPWGVVSPICGELDPSYPRPEWSEAKDCGRDTWERTRLVELPLVGPAEQEAREQAKPVETVDSPGVVTPTEAAVSHLAHCVAFAEVSEKPVTLDLHRAQMILAAIRSRQPAQPIQHPDADPNCTDCHGSGEVQWEGDDNPLHRRPCRCNRKWSQPAQPPPLSAELVEIVERLDELHKKATPGPWEWEPTYAGGRPVQGSYLGETLITLGDTYEKSNEDCALVAELRNNWSAISAALRSLVKTT